jgi:hypothetical protein
MALSAFLLVAHYDIVRDTAIIISIVFSPRTRFAGTKIHSTKSTSTIAYYSEHYRGRLASLLHASNLTIASISKYTASKFPHVDPLADSNIITSATHQRRSLMANFI